MLFWLWRWLTKSALDWFTGWEQALGRTDARLVCWSTCSGRPSRCMARSAGTPAQTSTPSSPTTCLPSSSPKSNMPRCDPKAVLYMLPCYSTTLSHLRIDKCSCKCATLVERVKRAPSFKLQRPDRSAKWQPIAAPSKVTHVKAIFS